MKDCKVLTIQDYSSFGQCSLSVALPIISAMGIETVSLPVALLSTHTSNFKGYTYVDLKANILPAVRHFKELGLEFEYIYIGYLGSVEVAKAVAEICDLNPSSRLIVDPAMAEDGELYSGIAADYVNNIAALCKKSAVALPNLSEACLLADVDYCPVQSRESISNICQRLVQRGIKQFVITGIKMQDNVMRLALYDKKELRFVETQQVKGQFFGSGDVLASTFVGGLANGLNLNTCLDIAVKYTQRCVETTSRDASHWYGLKFEKNIPYLIKLLEDAKSNS